MNVVNSQLKSKLMQVQSKKKELKGISGWITGNQRELNQLVYVKQLKKCVERWSNVSNS